MHVFSFYSFYACPDLCTRTFFNNDFVTWILGHLCCRTIQVSYIIWTLTLSPHYRRRLHRPVQPALYRELDSCTRTVFQVFQVACQWEIYQQLASGLSQRCLCVTGPQILDMPQDVQLSHTTTRERSSLTYQNMRASSENSTRFCRRQPLECRRFAELRILLIQDELTSFH